MTHKERTNKEHLHILRQILEGAGFQVSNYLDNSKEPYIYVHKPTDIDSILESLSFDGIRIYTRGRDIICYRSQNKQTTEPFGESRQIDVNSMFRDLVKEGNKMAVGHRIMFYIIKEIKEYFLQSAAAEREGDDKETPGMGTIIGSTMGTDYSQQVTSPKTNYGGA